MLISFSAFSQEKKFNRTCKRNTVKSYEKFINKFPNSEFTEEAEYKKSELVNTSSAYEYFLNKYPANEFSEEAKNNLCKIEYLKIEHSKTIKSFKDFLERFSDCKHYNYLARKTLIMLEYKKAESINTIDAYKYFLKVYPANEYKSKAEKIIMKFDFEIANKNKSINAYNDFINKYPEGIYTNDVKTRLINLEFQNAKNINSINAFDYFFEKYSKCSNEYYDKAIDYLKINLQDYDLFLSRHPNSKLANIIKERYGYFKYNIISNSYSIKELEEFVKEFPNSEFKDIVQSRINDIKNDKKGKNIFDLIIENKVEIKTKGSNITEVKVKIRKLVPYNISVLIPPGTFFVSHSSSSQNMVTRRHKKINLADDNWHSYSIDAACANRIKKIPGKDDKFDVQRSSNQKELELLMDVLSKEKVSSSVEQAAIWIVTDNASYYDLGILVQRSRFQYYGGSRIINEYETARAMQICAKAKIPIKSKAIWRDKTKILKGLKNEKLKTWLQYY